MRLVRFFIVTAAAVITTAAALLTIAVRLQLLPGWAPLLLLAPLSHTAALQPLRLALPITLLLLLLLVTGTTRPNTVPLTAAVSCCRLR
jgi:hypothetical protein